MGLTARPKTRLLSASDPAPVELLRVGGRSAFVLTCEHGGRAIPAQLADLGLPAGELDRHIGWDIGAEAVARGLSAALDAPLAVQRFSRLVIDCNRPPGSPQCIPEISDGTIVPANRGLDEALRAERWEEIHAPFHDAVAALLDERARAGPPTALVCVHSFTGRLATDPRERPWHLGLLARSDERLSTALVAALAEAEPDLVVARNEPYRIESGSDYTIPVHGEARGLPHVLIEIRQDLIGAAEGQARWINLLAAALRASEAALFA